MLFNSYVFIFVFLPVTLAGFFLLGRFQPKLAAAWLTAASLFFYGWWNPLYVGLLGAVDLLQLPVRQWRLRDTRRLDAKARKNAC